MTMFSILMPGKEVVHELKMSAKNDYFQNLVKDLANLLCESKDLEYIRLNSQSITKCKKFMKKETLESISSTLIAHIN